MATRRRLSGRKKTNRKSGKVTRSAGVQESLAGLTRHFQSAHASVRSAFSAAVSIPEFLASVTPLPRRQRLTLVDQDAVCAAVDCSS